MLWVWQRVASGILLVCLIVFPHQSVFAFGLDDTRERFVKLLKRNDLVGCGISSPDGAKEWIWFRKLLSFSGDLPRLDYVAFDAYESLEDPRAWRGRNVRFFPEGDARNEQKLQFLEIIELVRQLPGPPKILFVRKDTDHEMNSFSSDLDHMAARLIEAGFRPQPKLPRGSGARGLIIAPMQFLPKNPYRVWTSPKKTAEFEMKTIPAVLFNWRTQQRQASAQDWAQSILNSQQSGDTLTGPKAEMAYEAFSSFDPDLSRPPSERMGNLETIVFNSPDSRKGGPGGFSLSTINPEHGFFYDEILEIGTCPGRLH